MRVNRANNHPIPNTGKLAIWECDLGPFPDNMQYLLNPVTWQETINSIEIEGILTLHSALDLLILCDFSSAPLPVAFSLKPTLEGNSWVYPLLLLDLGSSLLSSPTIKVMMPFDLSNPTQSRFLFRRVPPLPNWFFAPFRQYIALKIHVFNLYLL
jgi:hypothetical protein